MKERIFIDETEIVAGVTMGTQATRMSWKADELQEITVMQMEVKKLFKKEMQELLHEDSLTNVPQKFIVDTITEPIETTDYEKDNEEVF